ncbi:MAG: uroporphyrinogen-III synthase [Alphaproteobacteria bacterium HGW-Alphaproteobacteria-2]|nr:MAG: uroporphyrinogen-III synthase [Alphaproteobacteria bacterium HGW-Alphaproteobacteria-2]
MPDDRPSLIVTRPERAARRFAAAVEARLPGRYRVLVAPLLDIVPVAAAPDAAVDALVLTSENAAERAAELLPGSVLPAFCVGARTAEAARAAGFGAESADGAAEDLLALIRARVAPGSRLLYLRGRHVAVPLGEALSAAGYGVAEAVVYDQRARHLSAAARTALAGPGVVALFSPRSARLLAEEALEPAPGMLALCLSAAVAEALGTWPGTAPLLAARPEAAAMVDALAALDERRS